jgi:hypothetical protein
VSKLLGIKTCLKWLRKIKALVCSAVCSSFSVADRLLTPLSPSNGLGIQARRPDNQSLREICGGVVNFIVEQEHEGFWTPVFVCQMDHRHLRRFLVWLHAECSRGQFDVPFDRVRVKRSKIQVNPTWKYDGIAAWPL